MIFGVQILLSLFLNDLVEIFNIPNTQTAALTVNAVFYLIYLPIPMLVAFILFRFINRSVIFSTVKRTSPKKPILYVCGVIGIGYLLILFINFILSSFNVVYTNGVSISGSDPIDIALCYLIFAIMPAVIEEWAFRGVILKNLLPFGKYGAIIVSSLLFGIMHFDPIRIVFASFFGFFLGLCYEYTGSLKIPMLIHLINNAMSVTASLSPLESKLTVYISILIFAFMGIGIGAIIYYLRHGYKRHRISLVGQKPYGYKISTCSFILRTVFNPGIVLLIIILTLVY